MPEGMPPELRALFVRFIQLAALVPPAEDVDPDDDDAQAVATRKLVLAELAKVHDEMRKFPGMARALAAIEAKLGPLA
jgi:hypothetical protein